MDEGSTEQPLLATFEKRKEFLDHQESFLSLNLDAEPTIAEDKNETRLLRRLIDILDEYQEQSYLLDPFLEQLTVPVVERLKKHARSFVSQSQPDKQTPAIRVGRLASLLHGYIKCRGYKTIVRFFPHEVADLSIALGYILSPSSPAQCPANWALRYVTLLWLSLICMIPFDLAKLDDSDHIGHTAVAVESLAKGFLGNPGLEREGAAIILSRLFIREDTRSRFHPFLEWSSSALESTTDVFTSVGILEVLCEITKSGPARQVQVDFALFLRIGTTIGQSVTLSNNSVIRKLRTKLLSRVALRLLPAKPNLLRRNARLLGGTALTVQNDIGDDIDVPDEIELVLEQLFKSLQDKDTIVRWSASKGIARIAERLPMDFASQVLDTIFGLFDIHSVAAATLYDMPSIAESTWHGACLSCAEMARRGLVGRDKLPGLIERLSKALYFDIRKGAHSVGSSVRDAAAYVLWALARAQDASALAPHAKNLAVRLATVALYDREVHIRRAASAAFQEHVGRLGLFPHGIDVLRKTEFYSVSLRRNAFLVAAPQVAEHPEYRDFLLDHLLTVTLRHWDPAMRELASQSLRMICSSELAILGPQVSFRASQLFGSVDVNDIHGGLLALAELAAAYHNTPQQDEQLRGVFKYLADIPTTILFSPRNELVAAAACHLISSSISLAEIQLGENSAVPHWRKIIENGLKHRSGNVQKAAANAMASVSRLEDCSLDIKRTLIPELKRGNPTIQQSLGQFLAALDYAAFPNCLSEAIQCLLECVEASSKTRLQNVEARRNCYIAMPCILNTVTSQLQERPPSTMVQRMFVALKDGLNDYTVDERGDVGSWIRIACIRGLTAFSEILFTHSGDLVDFDGYLPSNLFHEAVGGILKQGVERLDGVRQVAGENFLRLLLIPPPAVESSQSWRIKGDALIKEIFLTETETVGWNDGSWLYPRAVRLLEVEWYRKPILAGLVSSIGSKTDSTQRPASLGLVTYSRTLPTRSAPYNLIELVQDLINHAKIHAGSNAIVVPVLQTFTVLLEADVLGQLSGHPDGLKSLEALFSLSSKNVPRLKSTPRITECMKIVVNLLTVPTLIDRCVSRFPGFLAHQFPKIRSDTAEYLYLALQTKVIDCDTEKIEEVLLETEWTSDEIQVAEEAAHCLVRLFLGKALPVID